MTEPTHTTRGAESAVESRVTPLYGRDEDLARICAPLDSGQMRLLTLTGPGGVGKTRLAEEIVDAVGGDYADGAVAVPLAPLRVASQVLPAIARACGLPHQGDLAAIDSLATALRARHQLLYLDNFEHLLDPAPVWLGDLLERCPRLTVLVTSRIPLHLRRERRYPVAPLAVPGDGEAGETPSEALFVERASAVQAGFAPDAHARDSIAAICRYLDGLPLAIELAAARTTILSPGDLLTRLEGHSDLLVDGPRDAPERQQSLQATIAWSYDLLADHQQRLFRQLGVFRGGFTLAAAEAISGPPAGSIADVLGGIAALVDASLVQGAPMPDGTTRYRMLETIRAFAADRLAANGEDAAVRDRHASWCMSLGDAAPATFSPSTKLGGLNRLEHERANILVALEWLESAGRIPDLARLVTALRWFWYLGDHVAEGIAWYERLMSYRAQLSPSADADAVRWLGQLAQVRGDPRSESYLNEALDLATRAGDTGRLAEANIFLAILYEDRGDYDLADRRFTIAQEGYQRVGDNWALIVIAYHRGVIAFGRGDIDQAKHLLDSAVADAWSIGDRLVPAWGDVYRILVACAQEDDERATRLIYGIWADASHAFQHLRSEVLYVSAVFAQAVGQIERAARLVGAAEQAGQGRMLAYPERAVVDKCRLSLHQRLGSADFERGVEQGRHLRRDVLLSEIEHLMYGDDSRMVAPTPTRLAESQLSPREREVLVLMAEGMTNQEIADALFISPRTAANHVGSILTRLNLGSRTAAVAYAIRHDLA